jgi:hypothetical protein
MTTPVSKYDDDHSACEYTHVTLRVYSEKLSPEELAQRLPCPPTSTQRKGDVRNPHGRRPMTLKLSGWFLCSEAKVASKDVRRHLDWLLDAVGECGAAPRDLLELGAWSDIMCLWISKSGNDRPTLSPYQCRRMADLGRDCWFDVYVGDDQDGDDQGERKPHQSTTAPVPVAEGSEVQP